MSPVVLIVALVFGLVAAAYYVRALQQAQPRLAPQLRAGPALGVMAWAKSIPEKARRDYVLSLAYSSVFIVCIGILAYREGSRVVAVIFVGIALLGVAMTFARWLRLRGG